MKSMMMTIHGYVGSTPTVQEGGSGTKWVRFRVANNSSYRDQNGKWSSSETTWFTCKAWGNLAVNIGKSLRKGDPIVASGTLVPTAYNRRDKQSGEVTAQMELVLHLSHAGVDLAHGTTMNIKWRDEPVSSSVCGYDCVESSSAGESVLLERASQEEDSSDFESADSRFALREADSIEESGLVAV